MTGFGLLNRHLMPRKRLLLGVYAGLKLVSLSSLVMVSGMGATHGADLPAGAAPLPVASQTLRQAWRNAVSSIDSSGRNMTIDTVTNNPNQENSLLWWDSFNIAADHRVEFIQPSANHIALNRIARDTNPSIINGQLVGNGHIYLINPNGIVFGTGSTVNVNRLVASSLALNIQDDNEFILGNANIATLLGDDRAAFANEFASRVAVDENGNIIPGVQFDNYQVGNLGAITIENGAVIETPENGSVFIFGPQIFHQGSINTAGGQTILAATDDKVYLTPSTDTDLRGFLVEVSSADLDLSDETTARINIGGSGVISADRGNITLAALSINHQGTLQATTSVSENGSIRLIARDDAVISTVGVTVDKELALGFSPGEGLEPDDGEYAIARTGGEVQVSGSISITPEKTLVTDEDTGEYITDESTGELQEVQVSDQQVQSLSTVEITGQHVRVENTAHVLATGGNVTLHATATPDTTARNDATDTLNARDDSSIVVKEGAVIDVSGATDAIAAMARNEIDIRATADFLRDSPLQREGVVRGQTLQVDARYGTPLGDISPVVSNIDRGIAERLGAGGDINILSQGGLLVEQGSTLDASGGWLTYLEGFVTTSQLATSDRQVVNVADANINYDYVAVSSGSVTDEGGRWGESADRSWQTFGGGETRYYETYQHGLDAGNINIETYAVGGVSGNLLLQSHNGRYQRDVTSLAHAEGGNLNLILGIPDNGTGIGLQNVLITDLVQDIEESTLETYLTGPSDDASWRLNIHDDVLNNSGLGSLHIETNGRVDIDQNVNLQLTSGASVDVVSGGSAIDGDIQIASGDVSFATLEPGQAISVAGLIDVSGTWMNDLEGIPGRNLYADINLDGGRITLDSQGDLLISERAALKANGGGWLQQSGQLVRGNGGVLDLSINQRLGSAIELDGTMQAYALGRGGKVKLTANEINIDDFSSDALITQGERGELQIAPAFFNAGGFADFELVSNISGLTVSQDVGVDTVSLELIPGIAYLEPGADLISRLPHIVRDTYHRSSNTLTLAANRDATSGASIQGVTISEGVIIDLDAPESSINLIAQDETDLVVQRDTLLRAPGGVVSLIAEGTESSDGFEGNQVIRLEGDIDVSGRFVQNLDEEDARIGRLYNGGEVNIIAGETPDADTVSGSGFVFIGEDSHIDIRGAVDRFDVINDIDDNADVDYVRQRVASRAGSINVYAAEGMILRGHIDAQAVDFSGASGGSLNLVLNSTLGADNSSTTQSREAREFHLYQDVDDLPDSFQSGTRLRLNDANDVELYVGNAYLSSDRIAESGLSNLSLHTPGTYLGQSGSINFHGDVDIAMDRSLQILVPRIRGIDSEINLSAPYVQLGSSDIKELSASDLATDGSSVLNVTAEGVNSAGERDGLLEIRGDLLTQSVNTLNLNSAGDIRFRGLLNDTDEIFESSLTSYRILNIQADQVYGATLTDARVSLLAADSHLTINPGADDGQGSSILSAGSHLTFNAATIDQSGVVKAPIGRLTFNATDQLNLNSGSITSVSGEGLLIPYGITQGELEWIYPLYRDLDSSSTRLLSSSELLSSRSIDLVSDDVRLNDGAVVNLNATGVDAEGQASTDNLYAWEFVPGLGGSADTLSSVNSPDSFAVLPASDSYAPYDFVYWEGDNAFINPGEQIYLQGSAQLEAGLYTVLPARYALLPGAKLVTPLSSQDDYIDNDQVILANEQWQQLNGAQVVAGQSRFAATDFSDANWTAFAIEDGETVRSRSEYVESFASQFFRDQALREDTLLLDMPEDGGTLNILGSSAITLGASVQGEEGVVEYQLIDGSVESQSGRGSQVNIAATDLAVVNNNSTLNPDDVELQVADLNRLDVASILLGGIRSRTTEGTEFDVASSSVTIDIGSQVVLQARDLILTATDSITVASDSQIKAVGSPIKLDEVALFDENGAMLRISSADQMRVIRDADMQNPSGGTLDIEASAQLTASNSILIDADVDSTFSGNLAFVTEEGVSANGPLGSLYLGSSHIALGRDDVSPGISLTHDQVQDWNVSELVLASRTQLDLYGDPETQNQAQADLQFNDLTIYAAAINGHQTGGGQFVISAGQLSLGSLNAQAVGASAPGTADLVFNSATTRLLDGAVTLSGFNNVTVHASQEVIAARNNGSVFEEGSTLFDVSGNVTINTARITAETGVSQNIETVQGSNSQLILGSVTAENTANEYLGGELNFAADVISHQGLIEAHSGAVNLTSRSGDLDIAAGSVIDVSGIQRDFYGEAVYSYGGDVELTSNQQNVNISSNALIDVSSAVGADGAGADAGSLSVSAAQGELVLGGELRAAHGSASRAGDFELDVFSLADLSALNAQLNTSEFTERRSIRQRTGNMVIADGEGDDVIANQLFLSADNGSIVVQGQIDARGDDGGRVELSATDGIELQGTAIIDASVTTQDGDGGLVILETCAGAADLTSCGGTLNLALGSVVNVAGGSSGQGGKIQFRVPRNTANNGVQIQSLDGQLSGFERLDIEGYQRYDGLSQLSTALTDANNFMLNDVFTSLGLNAKFDTATLQTLHLRPGIELTSTGDMTSASQIDFRNNSYTNQLTGVQESGVLSLRAAGDLNINANIQDGVVADTVQLFSSVNVERLVNKDAWSYRLISGADLSSARSLQVVEGQGDLTLANNTKLRTGTGDIDIASGGQINLGDNAAIYTAGRPSQLNPRGTLSYDLPAPFNINTMDAFFLPGAEFPLDGGDIRIRAEQSIIANVDSFVSGDWLHRVGGAEQLSVENNRFGYLDANNNYVALDDMPVVQGISLIDFSHGVGALGGGDVIIESGADISNLAVSIPDTIKPVDEYTIDTSSGSDVQFIYTNGVPEQYSYEINGGGNVQVTAKGDISQSMFLADNGVIDVHAGGYLGGTGTNQGVLISSADTQVLLSAGNEINLMGVTNTSRSSMSSLQGDRTAFAPEPIISATESVYFNSYSDDSSVQLTALGSIAVQNRVSGNQLDATAVDNLEDSFLFYPASLSAVSFDGDISLQRTMIITPSAEGHLSLLANDNLIGFDASVPTVSINMPDIERTRLSSLDQPVNVFASAENLPLGDLVTDGASFDFADTPLHATNDTPIRIVAREGDIRAGVDANAFFFVLPKQAEMIAGRDIRGVGLANQNLSDDAITLVQAGRDIRYIDAESTVGASRSASDLMGIRTGGPGMLQVLAGRRISLGDRQGIVVEGDTRNTQLRNISDQGADLYIMSGLGEQDADYTSFVDHLFPADGIAEQFDYASDLISFVSDNTAQSITDFNVALEMFRQLPLTEQREFLMVAFFKEITLSSQRAAAELSSSADVVKLVDNPGNAGRLNESEALSTEDRLGYSRGLEAINVLFPGTIQSQSPALGVTKDDDVNTLITASQIYNIPVINNAYSGEIALTSSVIKAQDQGSDIVIAAPGGFVNVGLSIANGNADDRGIIARGDGNIGIFAHNDVSVNESRVQALSGGDIVIWSTKGNVDAGRGATTLKNVPPPVTIINPNTGEPETVVNVTVQGSGIRATSSAEQASSTDQGFSIALPTDELSNVVLAAPDGAIDAGDAGIDSNNLSLATDTVLNANNIEASGDSVGVPSGDAGAIALPSVDQNALGGDGDSELVAQDASEQFGAGSVAILRVEVIDLEEDTRLENVPGAFGIQKKPSNEPETSPSRDDDQAFLETDLDQQAAVN